MIFLSRRGLFFGEGLCASLSNSFIICQAEDGEWEKRENEAGKFKGTSKQSIKPLN